MTKMFDLTEWLINQVHLYLALERLKWSLIITNYSATMYLDFIMNIWSKWESGKIMLDVLEGAVPSPGNIFIHFSK